MASVSICVTAYNEEKNIGKLLEALLKQKTRKIDIKEIVVVSSGSTDRTNTIVKEFAGKDRRIMLVVQEKREGKSSAINLFLKNAKHGLCVLESADTIPDADTVERLCIPLLEKGIGMTGARPVPTNNENTFFGFAAHFIWKLHHEVAMKSPKCGEMIAFKNIVRQIPKESAVDEASIEKAVREQGQKIVYMENAIVRNRGPGNLKDLVKQRRRIAAGHLWLKKQGYTVATSGRGIVFNAIRNSMPKGPKKIVWAVAVIAIEVFSRAAGYYDFHIAKRNPFVWEVSQSTKEVKNA